uniref:Uncharacterized protein n=1 Tax=Cucumis melo TaxID=3656 RepID=A0A9I9EDN1_CUCME
MYYRGYMTSLTPAQALSHSLQVKLFSLQLTVFNAFFMMFSTI